MCSGRHVHEKEQSGPAFSPGDLIILPGDCPPRAGQPLHTHQAESFTLQGFRWESLPGGADTLCFMLKVGWFTHPVGVR